MSSIPKTFTNCTMINRRRFLQGNDLEMRIDSHLARKKSEIISTAITERLGLANWKMQELDRRLIRKIAPNGQESFDLDNKRLLEMLEMRTPETKLNNKGDEILVTIMIKYRIFGNE